MGNRLAAGFRPVLAAFLGMLAAALPVSAAAPQSMAAPAGAAAADSFAADSAASTDAATAGTFAFSASGYIVPPKGTSIKIGVARSGGSSGAVSVNYATASGTAKAGTDYTATSGTLNWADGDAAAKTFTIVVNSAANPTESRTILLSLSSPGGGAALGTPARATVTLNADASPGVLQLSVSTYRITQDAGSLVASVYRSGGSHGAVSVKYASANDTALSGRDYTVASGTLNWAAGDADPKTFSVPISNAAPFYGTRDFTLKLLAIGGGATLGPQSSATAIITGDANPGTLALSASSYSVAQNAGSLVVSVVRTVGFDSPVRVDYTTAKGSAVAGADYSPVSGTLSWAAGDHAAKTFAVPISDYAPFQGSKTFAVSLLRFRDGSKVGSPVRATVTINGVTGPGTLALASSAYSLAQNAGPLVVGVSRSGGANGAVSVSYATADRTAKAGADYTASSGTLSWASGDSATKTFKIPINGAVPFTGTHGFVVTLSSPAGGAGLGTASATVSINGAGKAGTLAFPSTSYTAAQNAGVLTLTVVRSGSSGAVSVGYSTADGTAAAGVDYTATNGVLNWADGDSAAKIISVPVGNALAYLGSKTFSVNLASPGGGALIGAPAQASVTITGAIADHPSTADAVRFLEQSSFGPTDANIALLQQIGLSAYLDRQFSAPISGYPITTAITADSSAYCRGSSAATCVRDHYTPFPLQMRFFQNALHGDDQLRQRVAWALAQIFVISANKVGVTYGLADYQQLLLKDAFGSYRQLLEDVTLSPAMGNYLDMVNNDKPSADASPNENYAREVMQLFSVGTVLLNSDGSVQHDQGGNPVPTYGQDVVEGFAHVFTGWTYPPPSGSSAVWNADPWYRGQMTPLADHHDSGSKLVLGGLTLPAGQPQAADLQQALDSIANHPNVAPFICRKLIQFLVTSNPAPAYVTRIAAVFNNNGSGARGDLKAVVRAILLDPEARGDAKTDGAYGKLREPVLFLTGVLRGLGGTTVSDGQFLAAYSGGALAQDVFDPATVFNFYPPDYPLTGTSLVAPVLAIYNTNTGLLRANLLDSLLQPPRSVAADPTVSGSEGTALDLNDWIGVAGTSAALADKLNRIYFHGAMSSALRNVLTQTIDAIPSDQTAARAQAALYLALTSAEYQVEQ